MSRVTPHEYRREEEEEEEGQGAIIVARTRVWKARRCPVLVPIANWDNHHLSARLEWRVSLITTQYAYIYRIIIYIYIQVTRQSNQIPNRCEKY